MNSDPRMDASTRNGVSEEELKAKVVGKRVTMEDVEGSIAREFYFTAAEGATFVTPFAAQIPELKLLTICVLVLKNGWTILGKSACADPANFNKELGQRIARGDAINQIWPLLGYQLRTKIHQGDAPATTTVAQPAGDGAGKQASTPDWALRLEEELSQVTTRYLKLETFIGTDGYKRLPMIERSELSEQFEHMAGYMTMLRRRLTRYRMSLEV